jgi:hypothetical protein
VGCIVASFGRGSERQSEEDFWMEKEAVEI